MIWNNVSRLLAMRNAQRATKDERIERRTLRVARFFMKVLLLQPPVEDFYNTDIRLQPVGLAYLKAAAEKHLPEIQVTIKDYHHGWGRRTIPLPRELAYLKDYYSKDDKGPFSTFHHFYHFGAGFDTIAEEVAQEKPDLVGIASLFAPYHREVLRCADAIKKRFPVPILLGGAHVSAMPETMLAHPAVDFVICGEGEKPFVEFLKAWLKKGSASHRTSSRCHCEEPQRGDVVISFHKNEIASPSARNDTTCENNSSKILWKIPNLGFKKNGQLIFNPRKENFPIESLPIPDFSDLPKKHYLFEKKPLCFIITSRGCPYHCAFCSVHKTFGHKRRRRSAENILAEIKQRYDDGYRVFDFEDDNLTFNRKEMTTLCKELVRAFPKKDIQLLAMNGVCYWTLDHRILRLMRQAGFTHLNLSLVSANTALLKTVHRPNPLKKYRDVVKHAAALGFKVVAYQILGLPGDTIPSMIRTLLLNARLPALLGASPFYLIPRSPIARHFEAASETDILKARLTAMAIETGEFNRDDLYTLLITTRILNFLKGLSLPKVKTTLSQALAKAAKRDARSAAGTEILRRLFLEKILYAATFKGFEPVPHFKSKLFFRLWQNLDIITTQENRLITAK